MIDFSCRCGFRLSVPQDMAGGVIQCPQCKLLADVPGLGELDQIEGDGTLKVQEIETTDADRKRFERAYFSGVRDEDGFIDRRITMDQVDKAGEEQPVIELAPGLGPTAPKYDPETGELIRGVEIKPPAAAPEVPVAVLAPTLSYATDAEKPMSLWKMPLRMLMGANGAALLIVLALHLLLAGIVVTMRFSIFFCVLLLPFFLFLTAMIFAHWANIVEDVGPQERNEFPTPGRDINFGDDLFRPFARLTVAVVLGNLPAALISMAIGRLMGMPDARQHQLYFTLSIVFSVFFPAIFLTLATSGTFHNMRPDRVLGVIRQCGGMYAVSGVLWFAVLMVYGNGLALTMGPGMNVFIGFSLISLPIPAAMAAALGFPILFAGVFVMHMFCWHLGLCYRALHDKFPWVLQRHIPKKKIEPRIPKRRPSTGQAGAQPPMAAIPVDPIPAPPPPSQDFFSAPPDRA